MRFAAPIDAAAPIATTAFVAALAIGSVVHAQQAAGQATGTARANVLRTLGLQSERALNFGVLAPSPADASVTIKPDGTLTTSDSKVIATGPHASGSFSVNGQANRAYAVSLPSTIALSSAAGSLTVSNLLVQYQGAASTGGAGQIDGSGGSRFTIGATLALPSGAPAGTYTGAYTVTVTYQ